MKNESLVRDISGRGEKIIKANLSPEEQVLVKLKGMGGEAIVATTKRAYVVKWGLGTGNAFGGRCNAFAYPLISAVEIRKNLITGTVEILTPAHQNAKKNYWGAPGSANSVSSSDNVISIARDTFDVFQQAVNVIRERMSATHGKSEQSSGLDEIEKLASLRDRKLITDDEFQAKKKLLLGL